MTKILEREIERLKKMVFSLSAEVEEATQRAVKAITERDAELARQVIEHDYMIDEKEVEVEEECLKILALHQPVAIDLRFIIAVLKINSDLERVGDLAVNVAEHAKVLSTQPPAGEPPDFAKMARKALSMLNRSLDALVNMDANLARKVCKEDDEVDEMNRRNYKAVGETIQETPHNVGPLTRFLTVSHHLERVADHSTNISEDIIYMTEGQIVRHRTEQLAGGSDS